MYLPPSWYTVMSERQVPIMLLGTSIFEIVLPFIVNAAEIPPSIPSRITNASGIPFLSKSVRTT